MKPIVFCDGLSARQRTIDRIATPLLKPIQCVKQSAVWGYVLLTMMILSSCNGQTKGQESDRKKNNEITQLDSAYKPKVNIKVNRHFDDKGNLVGFDSTYSSFYSNIQGDTAEMDSLFNRFDRYFNRNHSSFFERQFNSLFFRDSLLYPDFFHRDFFMKRYQLNDAYMKNMMKQMDSIKNKFYKEESSRRKTSTDL